MIFLAHQSRNRLKLGISCFLPLFGAIEWPSIHEITKSDDMKQYSIGGNYDRPIPRRIFENKGVDRKMFGQSKRSWVQL